MSSIVYTVQRKNIKNTSIRIDRRTGDVQVSAPHGISLQYIDTFVRKKSSWIQKHLDSISETTQLFASSESFAFLFGERYVIQIHQSIDHRRSYFQVNNDLKIFNFFSSYSEDPTKKLFDALRTWHKKSLEQRLDTLIPKWEEHIGVTAKKITIRDMKSRWGSCNTVTGHITLNLSLARFPIEYLEHVIVHELAHLLERNHNAKFYSYMDTFLPEWKKLRKEMKFLC